MALVFFDKPEVMAAVDRGTRKALSKFGAYTRTRAKTSIKKRKRTSAPGSPPSSHTGALKRLIFFGYDAQKKSVVIGPLPFRKNAAKTIEEGGFESGSLYRARPFMKPAFDAELKKADALFKDVVK